MNSFVGSQAVRCAGIVLLACYLGGCGGRPQENGSPSSTSKTGPALSAKTEAADAATSEKAGDTEKKDRPDNPAIKNLLTSIQPTTTSPERPTADAEAVRRAAGTNEPATENKAASNPPGDADPAAPSDISDQKSHESLRKVAQQFGQAVLDGDADAALALTVSKKDLDGILSAGGLTVLGGTLESRNSSKVAELIETLKDQRATSRVEPGETSKTHARNGIFQPGINMMSGVKVIFDIENLPAPVIVEFKQLFWVDDAWRIFQLDI